MTTMRIFVDTGFTDFIDSDLICIALVCGYDDWRELPGALDQRSRSQADDHPPPFETDERRHRKIDRLCECSGWPR
jgi:hypothetical protein